RRLGNRARFTHRVLPFFAERQEADLPRLPQVPRGVPADGGALPPLRTPGHRAAARDPELFALCADRAHAPRVPRDLPPQWSDGEAARSRALPALEPHRLSSLLSGHLP